MTGDCLKNHQRWLVMRILAPTVRLLWCDRCKEFRA